MNNEEADNELSQCFSTYGLITCERILSKYKINLPRSHIIASIKSPVSFYHYLLKAPLRNILNGIILQQANDYYVYIQKLFIDYLLSSESSKNESQGGLTRETIDNERQELLTLGEQFQKTLGKQDTLIASSQAALLSITNKFNKEFKNVILSLKTIIKGFDDNTIRSAMNHSLLYCEMPELEPQKSIYLFIDKMNEILNISLDENIKEKMANVLSKTVKIVLDTKKRINEFLEESKEIAKEANSFRDQFFESIIRLIELLKVLPDYKIDPNQDIINREPLYFDKNIGSL